MRKKTSFIALLLVGSAVLGVSTYAAVAAQPSNNDSVSTASLFRVSATGEPVALPPGRERDALDGSGYGQVSLIGIRGARNFFRIERANGNACYGSGRHGAHWPLGRFICQNGPVPFPSAEKPILDFSLAVQTANGSMHFERVEGVAADGVMAVDVVGQSSETILRIPVRRNFYSSGTADLGAAASKIQAVDAAGRVLTTIP